ncbi:hypothetical protein H7F51_06105 [Novosphingobium flavum]|uniref:Uncharacterized protein n=1 Tax=Novosphingobium flavum TaxID=1778672 RepID=A0A7X1KL95_9SPHN|nr:hypothetical protein [Novosphingobium flavum]MBC2665083.1 hypothetical protein [Novosphingobium flavum]
MAWLLADMRNTALAAGGMLVLAVLFADPSGMGGKAVDKEAGARAAEPAGGRAGTGASWYTAPQSAEPEAAPVSRAGPPAPQGAAAADAVHRPEPRGADFPAGLGPPRPGAPRYSSSVAEP